MLDGSSPMPEEEMRKEEVKMQIKELFDSLEMKIEDQELGNQIEHQRRIAVDILRKIDKTAPYPQEAGDEMEKYFRLLELGLEKIKNRNEFMAGQVKALVMNAKVHYDAGRTEVAYEELADPEGGAINVADMNSYFSEDLESLYLDIKQLCEHINFLMTGAIPEEQRPSYAELKPEIDESKTKEILGNVESSEEGLGYFNFLRENFPNGTKDILGPVSIDVGGTQMEFVVLNEGHLAANIFSVNLSMPGHQLVRRTMIVDIKGRVKTIGPDTKVPDWDLAENEPVFSGSDEEIFASVITRLKEEVNK